MRRIKKTNKADIMKKTKKRKKIRRVKNKTANKKKLIIITGAILVLLMLVSTYAIACGALLSYDGLGMKQEREDASYDLDMLKNNKGRYSYDDGFYHSRFGIDVSQYQGNINWKKAAEDGVEFAMLRLGCRLCDSGNIRLDRKYRKNLKNAKEAGIDVGVYFFSQATNTDEAIEEAKFVIRHIRGKGLKLPIAFDLEPVEGSDRITGMSEAEKTEVADAFCQVIEKAGYRAMVYGNPSFIADSYSMGYLTDYDTWLAHYTDFTDYDYKFTMWQYTDSGKVDGIDGYVDFDLYFEKD